MSLLQLTPLQDEALLALQALRQQLIGDDMPSLAQDLRGHGLGYGEQVLLAWRDGQPLGCVGWVKLDIASKGLCYAFPLLAADVDVAQLLLQAVTVRARLAGARQLRVSSWSGEEAKCIALRQLGFVQQFEWLFFRFDNHVLPFTGFSAGLQPVPSAEIDFAALAALFASTFRNVPNAPPIAAAQLEEDWRDFDHDASCVLRDELGVYRALCWIEEDGSVASIGVDDGLRGLGVAEQLYRYAASRLLASGVEKLTAMVASNNQASVRFHSKLGGVEFKPRGQVWQCALE